MSKHQKPLRAALIGISSKSVTSWGAYAHLPNFLTSAGRSRYTLSALLNSSVESAQEAIKINNLPSSTKAYGSPDDLAKDLDIDVVICNTRVDQHYSTILPSIRAGKDVFVEWPIAQDLEHIDELVQAARKSGSRVAVGLQRRWLPHVLKVKDILQSGTLGNVLSADVRVFGGRVDRQTLSVGLKYFTDRKIGGNQIIIGMGHSLDYVLSILGELDPKTVFSRLQLLRPDTLIKDPASGKILETVRSDVPDLATVNGTLLPSPYTDDNATLTYQFRTGQPFPGTPSFAFSINCEKGEILLVSETGMALETAPADKPVSIKVHRFDTDKVEDVKWEWTADQLEVSGPAQGVQTCLWAFADGNEDGDGWVGIDKARERAVLLDGMLKKWENETGGK